ncbi:hypothetical protein [Kitasatospora sp. LaBMicrA B282]|uniref:MarR family transcriptional regulator n=1 Tax=Kitasatospora sp. LaBMicrA B282 TaxID=3420949 RepID=UPI003D0CCF55
MSDTITNSIPTTIQPVTALTGAAADIYTELCGQQGVTAAFLALAAGVSPSAARKALVTLEQRGLARRALGGNDRTRRLPDLWSPTNPGAPTQAGGVDQPAEPAEDTSAANELPSVAGESAADTGGVGFPRQLTPDHPVGPEVTAAPIDQPVPGNAKATAQWPELDDEAPLTPEVPKADGDPSGDDVRTGGSEGPSVSESGETLPMDTESGAAAVGPTTVETGAEPLSAADSPGQPLPLEGASGMHPSGPTEPAGSDDQPNLSAQAQTTGEGSESSNAIAEHVCTCSCGNTMRPRSRKRPAAPASSGGPRLAPGQLHQMVLDHLRANSGQEWTPTGIARVLGRSSGAIGNALSTMVDRGEAFMTCDKPRRYQAARPVADDGPGAG